MRRLAGLFAVLVFCAAVDGCAPKRPPRKTEATKWFTQFPVDETWTVDVDPGGPAVEALPSRDRNEQVRDWLLVSLVSASGQPSADSANALAEVPLWRKDAGPEVWERLQRGASRVAVLPNHDVVVLVPKDSAAQRTRRIGTLLDQVRFAEGPQTGAVHAFEYGLTGPFATKVDVHRLPSEPIARYYESDHGYTKVKISSQRDLGKFIDAVDELVEARVEGVALVLEGRAAPPSSQDSRFRLSHAAEIFQADDPWRDYYTKWGEITAHSEAEMEQKKAQALAEKIKLAARFKQEQDQAGAWPSCGFSLDPQPESSLNPVYQQARYDCDLLRGTETGMILFYTDLLAKLWGFDFSESFPWHIAGFKPKTQIQLPEVYRERMEALSRTRTWLAPREGSFYHTDNALHFAPVATRVFALSSARPGAEEEDANPVSAYFVNWWNAHYAEIAVWEPEYARLNQVMKWSLLFKWLDVSKHAETVAFLGDINVNRNEWFPKWASAQGKRLRFQAWQDIRFDGRGQRGGQAETMNVLESKPFEQFGRSHFLKGGVSLANFGHIESAVAPPRRPTATGARLGYNTTPDGSMVTSLVNGTPDSSLKVTVRKGGINVLFKAGNAARAQRLSDALLQTRSGLSQAIMQSEGIDAAIRLPNGQFLLHSPGETGFSRLQKGPAAIVPSGPLSESLKAGDYLVVRPAKGALRGFVGEIRNRGPPAGSENIELTDGSTRVKAVRSDGEIHLARSDIPDAILNNPERLQRLLTSSTPQVDTANTPVVAALIGGNHREFAARVLESPQAAKDQIALHRSAGGTLAGDANSQTFPLDGPLAGRFLLRLSSLKEPPQMTLKEAMKTGLPFFYEAAPLREPDWDPALMRVLPSKDPDSYSGAVREKLPSGTTQLPHAIVDGQGRTFISAQDNVSLAGLDGVLLVRRKP